MTRAELIDARAEMVIAAVHIFRSAGGICPTFELPAEVCEAVFALLDTQYDAGTEHGQSRWWTGVTGGYLVNLRTPSEPKAVAS